MPTLPSGLSDQVDDGEDLARFLTQSNQFKPCVKPALFLPSPKDHKTSVSRHGAVPLDRLRRLGEVAAGARNLYGAAILKAHCIRACSLDVVADEPPEFHALICGWSSDADPVLRKAQQLEKALVLANAAATHLFT